MRRPLLAATTLALLLTSSSALAQDDPTGADGAGTSVTIEHIATSLPIPDYWTDWSEHKAASRGRVALSVNNIDNDRRRRPLFYREAVAAHRDELMWLANRQPAPCYAEEYERWQAAVEDLHAIGRRAVGHAKAGKQNGLKRVAKDRRAAVKRLDRVLSNVADCGPGAELEPVRLDELLVGKWRSGDNFVMQDGFHNKSRVTQTFTRDGRYLLRDSNAGACRSAGFGYVPATIHGTVTYDNERRWLGLTTNRAFCYPRGRPRQSMGWQGHTEGPAPYDAMYDVLYSREWGSCAWRADGGSPQDCASFWRGTPPDSEGTQTLAEEGSVPEDEDIAAPDEGED